MTFPQTLSNPAQSGGPDVTNENFETLSSGAVYGKKQPTTTGLTWGYYGGRWGGFSVADGTLALTASNDNYVVVEIATGTISVSTSSANWGDTSHYARVYKITAGSSSVSAVEDHRAGPGGIMGGGGGVAAGAAGGFEFVASSTTTDSDPGTGTLRWNNATQASATTLYVDNADADSTALATLWASLDEGAFLSIADASSVDVWQLWKVSGAPINGTGYYKFPVTLQAQEGGNIANGAAIRLGVDASASGALADGSVTLAKLADLANHRLIGRDTTGTGVPEAVTLSQLLDWIGSAAQGDILYRGASAWARLAAGTAKFMLQTAGAGADPAWVAPVQCIPIASSDETTAITAGAAKVTFRMPFAFKLTAVRASLTTAQPSGSIFTVDVNESGTSVLSTKITIDNTELTSTTAATPPVISDADLADDAEMTIDVDQVGTSGAAGLKVYLIGYAQ